MRPLDPMADLTLTLSRRQWRTLLVALEAELHRMPMRYVSDLRTLLADLGHQLGIADSDERAKLARPELSTAPCWMCDAGLPHTMTVCKLPISTHWAGRCVLCGAPMRRGASTCGPDVCQDCDNDGPDAA